MKVGGIYNCCFDDNCKEEFMSHVAIVKRKVYEYCVSDTFRPSQRYPEYPFEEIADSENAVYDMVRETFYTMKLDYDNYGKENWNPLKKYVSPGDVVLLKPNLVMDYNRSGEGTDCLYTQPSIVAAVIDYVVIALNGKGTIIVGDAPMQECDFEKLMMNSGYDRLNEYYKEKLENRISFEFADFRAVKSIVKNGVHYYQEQDNSNVVIDLGKDSEFAELSHQQYNNLRITNYDPGLLKKHHNEEKNEYCISKILLNADVIINLPKPKTHRKAGVTIGLKNIVGISARKEYLPHHMNGAMENKGDEYLHKSFIKCVLNYCLDRKNYYSQTAKNYSLSKVIIGFVNILCILKERFQKDPYFEGSWYGNDTICKTIVDLNKILFYADKNGRMCMNRQRKYFVLADMIISGEKEGPVAPSPKRVGIIAMGDNPVSFDETIATLMGAIIDKIPTLHYARNAKRYNLIDKKDTTEIYSNVTEFNNKSISEISTKDYLYFVPTSGWKEAFYTR